MKTGVFVSVLFELQVMMLLLCYWSQQAAPLNLCGKDYDLVVVMRYVIISVY